MTTPWATRWLIWGGVSMFLSACCSAGPNAPCRRGKPTLEPAQIKITKSVLEVRGGAHLDGLHPDFVQKLRALYEQAEARGIMLRFISGYRKYRVRRRVKRAQPNMRGKSLASWHNFGAAIDLNLQGRKSMKDALAHLDEDLPQWEEVGALAKSLGLTWGYQWGKSEIFHFEWHPGLPDAIRGPTLKKLEAQTGGDLTGRYKDTWSLFK